MARFGFVGPSYPSQSVNADCQKTQNWYVETLESEGKSAQALYPTPGTSVFCSLVGPSVRGEFLINGRMFAVSGAIFYEVFTNGTFTNRGAVATDGLPVSMAASATQLLLASGGSVYVYNLAANTLTLLPAATFTMPFTGANAYISLVGFSDGFFIALCANSGKWYVSKVLDATDWVTNGPTIVSVFPDNIVSMAIDHREVALFGVKQSVAYFNSGNIFPYDVIPGGFIEQGSIATYATSKLDNTVYWLAGDERGNGMAFKAQGYLPVRISNHAVENAWSKYPIITDARAYSYQDQGHAFYVLYFPSANGGDGATWVYDAATNMWHERAFLNVANGHFMAHHSQCHVFAFGKHLVGDWNSGNIYNMSINTFTDAGETPIVRIRRAPHVSTEQEWIFHQQLQADFETGVTPQPLFPDSPLSGGSDTFIRANENPLNPAVWTVAPNPPIGNWGHLQIFNNAAQSVMDGSGGVTEGVEIFSGVQFPSNQTAQFNILALANGAEAGIILRADISTWFSYEMLVVDNGGGFCHVEIDLWNGVQSINKILFQTAPFIFVSGDTFKFDANGSILSCYRNGALLGTANDNTFTTGGFIAVDLVPGIASSNVRVTNFSFSNIQTFRGPQAMLRWSDDGGHAWSNSYTVDCGTAGNYKTRAIWRRLGRSRDRVYEVSVSDPVPWRIVDSYLMAAPSYQPSERMVHQFRKSA